MSTRIYGLQPTPVASPAASSTSSGTSRHNGTVGPPAAPTPGVPLRQQVAALEPELLAMMPPDGYFWEHVAYGLKLTDCNGIFHIGSALCAISSLVADRAVLEIDGGQHPLHLWVLLTGRSQVDRKTSAGQLAQRLVEQLEPKRVIPEDVTTPALIEALAEAPQQTAFWFQGEFAQLLAAVQQGFNRDLPPLLMSLYDAQLGSVIRRRRVAPRSTPRNGQPPPQHEWAITDPRFTLLGACALPLLERYTSAHDWAGGFARRMMILLGRRRRFQRAPRRNRDYETYLASLLDGIRAMKSGTVIRLEDDALAAYDDWATRHDEIVRAAPVEIQGLLGDSSMRCLRVAGLYAISRKQAVVDLATMRAALRLTEASCAAVENEISAIATTAGDPEAQLRARLLLLLRETGGTCSNREALRRLRVPSWRLDRVYETLVHEERIVKRKQAGRGSERLLIVARDDDDGDAGPN